MLGISTVAGNQTLEKVTENALRVTSFFGLEDLRVVPGQARPLIRAPVCCTVGSNQNNNFPIK